MDRGGHLIHTARRCGRSVAANCCELDSPTQGCLLSKEQPTLVQGGTAVTRREHCALDPALWNPMPLYHYTKGMMGTSSILGVSQSVPPLFLAQLRAYSTDQTKVNLVISLLWGETLDWTSPFLEHSNLILQNWEAFPSLLNNVWWPPPDSEIHIAEPPPWQTTVATYASLFHCYKVDTNWKQLAQF